MRRHGSVGCALLLTACQSNPYFIGRFRDTACESHADAILCSGFEQADLSDWSGPIVDGAASVRQTTTAAHRGTGALLAESHGQESDAVVDESFA
ncbi:MAG TPA: hypothetical protein VGL13_00680, partial [Polyangiaceae bacterium]